MKGFEMDSSGDVVVRDNQIPMIAGRYLIHQKVNSVLQTKIGEWFLNLAEGIDFGSILGKGVTEDAVRFEIERGLMQVDRTFTVTEFFCNIDNKKRKVTVQFRAETNSGEQVEVEHKWA